MPEVTDRIEEARPRRFRPYPAYNDSGMEWLGEVPAHWAVYPLRRRLFREAGSIKIGPFGSALKLEFMVQEGFKVYGQEHAISRDFCRGSKYVDEPKFTELAACEIRPRDLVVTMMGSSGRCAVVPDDIETGIMDSHLLRIRLPDAELDPSFLALLIDQADYIRDQIQAAGKGAIMHGLNSSIVKSIVMAVPPTAEQLAILDFLDRETARIDALVARKERLIELLQEKRTALITRAVTRGLDPNVPMKDSGVEWLGEIPLHWSVRPLKSLSDLQTGLTLGKRYEGEAMTTRPYLRVANVQDGYLALDDIAEVEVPVRDVGRFELRMGDVLMTEGGDFDKLGRGYVWKAQLAQCLHQNHIFAVRPRRSALTSHFLALVMSSAYGRAYFTATSKQSTNLASTNSTKLRNLPIPLPGLDDQVEITCWTDCESNRIDALIAKVREAISHLKEFRTTLISAAVTGKIDVREAMPR